MRSGPVRNLSYYRSLEYSCILHRKAGGFVVLIPELSLCAEDETVEKALESLEMKKDEYFTRMIDNGLQGFIIEPRAFAALWRRTLLGPFDRAFLMKLVVVAVLLICFLGIGAAAAKRYLNPTRVVSRAFQIIDGLNEAPEETKERVRKRLHDTAVKLKPFARELKVMFDEDAPQPVQEKAKR